MKPGDIIEVNRRIMYNDFVSLWQRDSDTENCGKVYVDEVALVVAVVNNTFHTADDIVKNDILVISNHQLGWTCSRWFVVR